MNRHLLDPHVQAFLREFSLKERDQLAFSKQKFPHINNAELTAQLESRQKTLKKLPLWYETPGIIYPKPLSVEQSSSERCAAYKAALFSGQHLIDLTGGMGVDAHYFAKNYKQVIHCEYQQELSEIAAHNAQVLAQHNITFISGDGLAYLKQSPLHFDTIYIDPARRNTSGRVFLLSDCEPNILENLDLLFEKCNRIILKTSPLLDLSQGIQELKQVSEIHILSIKNECKELLWILEKAATQPLKIKAVSLNSETKTFNFNYPAAAAEPEYPEDLKSFTYLYEPDVALFKSGAFNLIAQQYGIQKISPNTHLYLANHVDTAFPGKIFKINAWLQAQALKKNKNLKANVISKNYPEKAEVVVKKYNIRPAALNYLIFSSNLQKEKLIIEAELIQAY